MTSPGAAALHDVVTALRRRAPHVPVVLAPAAVQGAQAPAELVARAARRCTAWPKPARVDVILLVRGGGSIEDLWAFNDEQLARTIVQSPVPLICGVGHETDFTIADFCADVRAPTPTAAAELAATPRDSWLAGAGSVRRAPAPRRARAAWTAPASGWTWRLRGWAGRWRAWASSSCGWAAPRIACATRCMARLERDSGRLQAHRGAAQAARCRRGCSARRERARALAAAAGTAGSAPGPAARLCAADRRGRAAGQQRAPDPSRAGAARNPCRWRGCSDASRHRR